MVGRSSVLLVAFMFAAPGCFLSGASSGLGTKTNAGDDTSTEEATGSNGESGATGETGTNGPAATFSVGGTLSGLAGQGLVLANGADTVTPLADGAFTMPIPLVDGAPYEVVVAVQPTAPKQTCSVDAGAGTIAGANVTSVVITCVTESFTLHGTLAGLGAANVTLSAGGTSYPLTQNGAFTLPATFLDESMFSVTIATQPNDRVCAVLAPNVHFQGANVANLDVACVGDVQPRYAAAPRWTEYVRRSNTAMACDGSEAGLYGACIHGGEARTVHVPLVPSCVGVSISDELGAFTWVCAPAGDGIDVRSTELARGKRVRDLLDVPSVRWRMNRVFVGKDGVTLASRASVWWSNAVSAQVGSGASAPYDVHITSSVPYYVNFNHVTVVFPTERTSSDPNDSAVNASVEQRFAWIEGAFVSNNGQSAVNGAFRRSVFHGVRAREFTPTSFTVTGSGNLLREAQLSRQKTPLNSTIGIAATYRDVRVSGGDFGVNAEDGSLVVNLRVAALNNGFGLVAGDNVVVIGSAFSHVRQGYPGIGSDFSFLNGTIAVSVNWEFRPDEGSTLADTVFYRTTGIPPATGANKTFDSIAAIYTSPGATSSAGVTVTTSPNRFIGHLKIGNNLGGATSCSTGASTPASPGFVVPGCTVGGADGSNFGAANAQSTAVFTSNVGTSDYYFVAATGVSLAHTPSFPWLTNPDGSPFAHDLLGWGGSTDFGQCAASGTCYVWDWSLLATDNVLREVHAPPVAGAVSETTHDWPTTTAIYLRHAQELFGDDSGNENGLCESNERCLFTPNIGAYQGHGALVPVGTFTGGSLSNITLYRYATNGR